MLKKVIIALSVILSLAGCDVKNQAGETSQSDERPEYVKDAKSDLGNAILANIIRNPDFKCRDLWNDTASQWYIGCFESSDHPVPFLLYEVSEDSSGANPPFKYKLTAINGKAKQYAENKSLRFLKIDTQENSTINIDEVINDFVKAYPAR